jgi:group I intron endonuclease
MIRTYRVYMYTNTVNSKKYVGITCTSLSKRAGVNGRQYKGSPFFYDAILKYGWDKFKGEILQDKLTKKDAAEFEKCTIDKHKTQQRALGYNLHRGGFETCWEDISTKKERIERIKQTLIKQRADPLIRAEMRKRMQAEWDNPVKRQQRLNSMKGNTSMGKPAVKIECLETGFVYTNMRQAFEATGIHKSCISRRLSDTSEYVLFKRKSKQAPSVHLRRYVDNNVDIKRRELLEQPKSLCTTTCPETESVTVKETSGLANQQPSSLTGEGSTTIPEGSTPKWVEALRP